MQAFSLSNHMLYQGHYKLDIDLNVYNEITDDGPLNISFNVLAARLFNLDYPTFLRMIRQDYDAELHGKVGKYISYSFTNKPKAITLVKELNERWIELQKTKSI